jgi:hypothetical protein
MREARDILRLARAILADDTKVEEIEEVEPQGSTPVKERRHEAASIIKYGEEYPRDSKYAELMSDYFVSPLDKYADGKWELFRDWFKKNRVSMKDAKSMLRAEDSGVVNMIFKRNVRSNADLDEVAMRLGIK